MSPLLFRCCRQLPRWLSRRDEAGFTLIEVLVAVIITAIIIGPVTASLIIGFEATASASKQLSGSDDRHLLELYLPSDLTSATPEVFSDVTVPGVLTPSTGETTTSGGPKTPCQGSTTSNELMISWPVLTGLPNGQPGTNTTYEEADYVILAFGAHGSPVPTQELIRYVYSPTLTTTGGVTSKVCGPAVSLTPVAYKLTTASNAVTVSISGASQPAVTVTFADFTNDVFSITGQERSV